MKTVLGLDLGTTSIGWAIVHEPASGDSKIIKTGVRILQYDNFVNSSSGKESKDPVKDFASGNGISSNAGRTARRGARRNLQRYKQRRKELINILKREGWINEETALTEIGKNTTHQLLSLRSRAVTERIELEELARVLLSINKKRGYKSNRKVQEDIDGQAIDGMSIAMLLHQRNIFPCQYMMEQMEQGKSKKLEFYPSDLEDEFDEIWLNQSKYYPELLSNDLKKQLEGVTDNQTWAICEKPFGLVGIKRTGTKKNQVEENLKWRVQGLTEQLDLEHLVIVFQEINKAINGTSSHLGKISDRSKQLILNNQTVGQSLFERISQDPHNSLKNMVFYRKDYLDEFNRIWEEQSKHYPKRLTNELAKEIRDVVIFYQRRLKSQKGLISFCEFEQKEVEIKGKKKTIGSKVVPKSSPIFQEFKIWQILNNLKFNHLIERTKHTIQELDSELTFRKEAYLKLALGGKVSANAFLKLMELDPAVWEVSNYDSIEGNHTVSEIFKAFKKIAEESGHIISSKNEVADLKQVFDTIGIPAELVNLETSNYDDSFEQHAFYRLWHLLYSYEGDDSKSGNEQLIGALNRNFSIPREYAHHLCRVVFKQDYGNLSAKAIKKILPHLQDGLPYSDAAALAGYNHSHAITKEENLKRQLKERLEPLKKNSLRNPVVEKILNQLVNVVNAILEEYGPLDEVRIELARELKQSIKARKDTTKRINDATKKHEEIRQKLQQLKPFNQGVRITKKDIVKYKLWEELAPLGYKTIYTSTPVNLEELFTKRFDIEHIIPKAVLFDDSFSNKTLATRDFNRYKSNKTGVDAVIEKYGEDSEGYKSYISNVESLFAKGKGVLSRGKYSKLLMTGANLPQGFIERDLRNSQYIAKKASQMLLEITRNVVPTTGKITSRLREEWELINVMQELNWDKFKQAGQVEYQTNKDGDHIGRIKDWTKRNDHRHHVMDAITVAFTRRSHIQYLNYMNARKDKGHQHHAVISAIEKNQTQLKGSRRIFIPPMPLEKLRSEVKSHLESTLVSFKAKNKVTTRTMNDAKGNHKNRLSLTPRGQLHKETVYGSSKKLVQKEMKIGGSFDQSIIEKVSDETYRNALLKRLEQFDFNPKNAFTGKNAPSKNPILTKDGVSLPEKVNIQWYENQFTIRKSISPDLKIDKVIDEGVKRALLRRLERFNGNPKEAFTNIENDPIWLNEEKGIAIKKVTITGVTTATPLHVKKDHLGQPILSKDGKEIPVDYVSLGNNHHVAIYQDDKGNFQEEVVSFYEAVERTNQKLPVIKKNHENGWHFLFTMKQNEMFVFPNENQGFDPNEKDLLNPKNYRFISPQLYRVQKIGTKDYTFRHHLETTLDGKLKDVQYKRLQSTNALKGIVKVRLDHLGNIVQIGEY